METSSVTIVGERPQNLGQNDPLALVSDNKFWQLYTKNNTLVVVKYFSIIFSKQLSKLIDRNKDLCYTRREGSLSWHTFCDKGLRFFPPVSSEGPPHLIASYDTQGDYVEVF
jgi:hypothetical protein